MTKLAALYGGLAPHRRTFIESEYTRFFDEVIYLLDLAEADLKSFDRLFIPSRLHIERRNAHGDRLRAFLKRGGDIVTFGQQSDPWLSEIEWTYRPTNFWWWLESDGDSGLRFPRPKHAFFDHVPSDDCVWHFHGSFSPPKGSEVLIKDDNGGAVLYIDKETWPGRIIVTTLDPTYHFGSHFMPATDRFLSGFLPWFRNVF